MTSKPTIKRAILETLEKNQSKMTYIEIFEYIQNNQLYQFTNAKTPASTISAILGDFIRNNDSRIKRIKAKSGYQYYLSKYESDIDLDDVEEVSIENATNEHSNISPFHERDLHILLSSYLQTQSIFTKTIHHERSSRSEEHQKWIHPDFVGLKLIKLKNQYCNSLRELVAKEDSFNLYSYEVKKFINSDYELKKCFFQAVSNSSWANYAYLVALSISDHLDEELERLNKAFGVGIIVLSINPFESTALYPAMYHDLDFQTIDKLCKANSVFEEFIEHSEGLLKAEDRCYKPALKAFELFSDKYFIDNEETEIEQYCSRLGLDESN